MSNLASHGKEGTEGEQAGTITILRKNFPNACKKSLAFLKREGVASASVQGLRIARSSLDGEAAPGFQQLVWSESAKCGSWCLLGASELFCL